MKRLYMKLLVIPVLLFVACKKDKQLVDDTITARIRPFVNYTIVPGDDPFTFKFENKSLNYKSLEWRFGDDSVSYEVSPQHVYLSSGKFEVNLKATAEDGSTARKLLIIDIVPERVLDIQYNFTQNLATWSVNSPAAIGALLWTFHDNTTSTSLNPVIQYKTDTIFKFNVKMTTAKGSVVEVKKDFSTKGFISDITNALSSFSVSKDNDAGKDYVQGSGKLIDNDITTKFYTVWSAPWWAKFGFESAQTIKYYGVGTANDLPVRDPKNWTFEGSDDGEVWEVLDIRNQTKNGYVRAGNRYRQMHYYEIANPKPYLFYRWHVTANFGDSGYQLSEIKLFK